MVEYKPEFDELFNFSTPELQVKERRRSARYVRNDIKASLAPPISVFGKPFDVKLLNISACGALIATQKRFPLNKSYILTLKLDDGTKVDTSVQIVHQTISSINKYGLQFDQCNKFLDKYLHKDADKE